MHCTVLYCIVLLQFAPIRNPIVKEIAVHELEGQFLMDLLVSNAPLKPNMESPLMDQMARRWYKKVPKMET